MSTIQQIAIIGTGNVAFHMTQFFLKKGVKIVGVYGRSARNLEDFHTAFGVTIRSDYTEISHDTLALLCVSDAAIPAVIEQLPNQIRAAYTSGSTALDTLPQERVLGVFYPLQTFSKGLPLNAAEIPFFIEANNAEFEEELIHLAKIISPNVHKATSKDRYHLHLAAVMSNNFVNHLFHLSERYLKEHNLPFEHLKPLIKETIRKIELASPSKTQTGPATRKDNLIIQKHLASLSGLEKEIYDVITRSIQKSNTTNDDEL
jgi:predicted short-subunit dehydrogenase-like oxidoreductase (DUF2520 family)